MIAPHTTLRSIRQGAARTRTRTRTLTLTQAYIKEQKWLDEVFDKYDTDRSGQLEKGELIELLRRVTLAEDARANPNPNPNPIPLCTGVVEPIGNPPPDSDLLSRQVSPGVEVTEEDEAYVLEMVDRCADTHLPVRATHACLLRAVRSEEA